MVPLSSVKFLPYWTQLDVNVQKVFNIGSWRYDARFSFYNVLNNGVVLEHMEGRGTPAGSTGADLPGPERPGSAATGCSKAASSSSRSPPASSPVVTARFGGR